MDPNLEDSLSLESSMGVQFVNAGDMVVSEGGINMEHTDHDIPMEYEHISEQQMMLDTGNEEIIDFMGDQIQLAEYSIENSTIGDTTIPLESEQSSFITSQTESIMDIQIPQTVSSASYVMQQHAPRLVPVQSNSPQKKKNEQYIMKMVSHQVKPKPLYQIKVPPKIAPKPAPPMPVALVANRSLSSSQVLKLSSNSQHKPVLKHYAIAPKPADGKLVGSLMSNVKPTMQKGPALAQIGKQIVMIPSNAGQKFKLVQSANISGNISIRNDADMAQIISRKGLISQDGKPIKFIVQGQQQTTDAPAMLTKVVSSSGPVTAGTPQNYITVQSKKVPLSGLVLSPKNFVKLVKESKKMDKTPSGSQGSPKKIILTDAQAKSFLKSGANTQNAGGTKTQIHQINVPGKGVQYIRLVTNPSATQVKAPQPVASKGKTFVFADNGGSNKNQKLVRIAPLNSKTGQMFMRSSQSLLAPISQKSDTIVSKHIQAQAVPSSNIKIEMVDSNQVEEQIVDNLAGEEIEYQEMEEKPRSLQTLITDTVLADEQQQDEENSGSSDNRITNEATPLIVVPPDYPAQGPAAPAVDDAHYSNDKRFNVELVDYQSDPEHLQEADPPMDMRPRKACNCTKSQCLKLYCDCFANGEFCNRCNCINCHNNLDNEELRQKAIRGCLERNPNAFRPKIGKTKSGGPEIVRRHNKGCNCKRSGCLKNYCECFEARIACSAMCKCVGCRNVPEAVTRRLAARAVHSHHHNDKQPCTFMTSEVIEAVCQCLIASASEARREPPAQHDPVCDVIHEFARCLQDIIDHARNEAPNDLLSERC